MKEVEPEQVQDSCAQQRWGLVVSLASKASVRKRRIWSSFCGFCFVIQLRSATKKITVISTSGQHSRTVSQSQVGNCLNWGKGKFLAEFQEKRRPRWIDETLLLFSSVGHKFLERVFTYPSLLLPVRRKLSLAQQRKDLHFLTRCNRVHLFYFGRTGQEVQSVATSA